MKRKNKIAVLLAALLLSLTGCQLAQPDSAAQGQDRLVGMLVTEEALDLFDFEAYVQDHAGQLVHGGELTEADMQPYEGRLYATLTSKTLYSDDGSTAQTREYVFEGVNGISCFAAAVPATETETSYLATISDAALSDGQMNLSYTDAGYDIDLTATIYVSPQSYMTFYFNPVYQTPDGQVYAVSGSCISSDLTSGEVSHTLEEESTLTENGASTGQRTSVKISIAAMDPPETIVLLQMDESAQVLSQETYSPEALPEEWTLDAETAYLIAETHSGSRVTRELLDRDAEALKTFRCREDGVCVEQYTALIWR